MRMKEKQKKFPVSSEALDQLISQVKATVLSVK